MPHQIEVPGQGVIEFPDSMTDEQITGVIKEKFYSDSSPDKDRQTALAFAVTAPLEAAQRVSKAVYIAQASRDQQIDDDTFLKAIGQEGQPPANALERAARNWQQAGMATAPVNVTESDIGGTKIIDQGLGFPRVQPPPEAGVTEKVAAGLYNVGISIPNFALSPEGITTMLAPEALPAKFAEPLLKGLFAGLMAKSTGEALGKFSVTKDPQDLTEALGSVAFTGALSYSGALEALGERRKALGIEPIKPPIKDLIKSLVERVRPASTLPPGEIEAVAPATAQALKKTTDLVLPKEDVAPKATTTETKAAAPKEKTVTKEETAAIPVGMGGATPQEFELGKDTPTGIKNATVDDERAARGLPPAVQPARKSFGEVWDRAMERIDSNPGEQDTLINELRSKPRALTDEEDAILLQRQIDLQNEYSKATRDLSQAVDDGRTDDVLREQVRARWLSDQLLDLYDIGKRVGTETGRGLAARRMMAYEDFSLAKMMLDSREARGGRGLTEEESAEIARLHEEIANKQKEHDEYAAKMDALMAELQSKLEHADMQKGAKGTGEPTDLDESKKVAQEKIKAKSDTKGLDSISDIQKLARAFVASGITDREALIDAVHEVIKEVLPEFTRRQTMDAISGYGDYKLLRKDDVSVTLRDLKGQMQQLGKLEDMAAKLAPQKTGIERRAVSDEERRLIKQVEEAKKKGGFNVTDPATQLRTALQAIKTRLVNQISDLEHQIKTGTKIVKSKTKVLLDTEAEQLKVWRDELKRDFDEMFGTGKTDAERIKAAIAHLEKQGAEFERRIKAGEFTDKPSRVLPETPELQAARARRDVIREQFQQLRDLDERYSNEQSAKELESRKAELEKQIAELEKKVATKDVAPKPKAMSRPQSPELERLTQRREALNKQLADLRKKPEDQKAAEAIQRKVEALNKRIAERERQIATGDIATKPSAVNRPALPEIEVAKQRLEDLNKQIAELRNPKKTPEQIALQSMKTRTANRIAELTDKLARGDYTTKPRRTMGPLDAEATTLKAQLERLKRNFQEGLDVERFKNRKAFEKSADWLTRLRRFQVLSSPVSLAKLVSAALQRMAFTPAEELIGGVVGRLIPDVASKAPREGGLNITAEVKAISSAILKGMPDAWNIIRTGKSDLDVLYGRRSGEPQSVLDFFGHVHGALKASTKRAEFSRAFEKRMQHAAAHGVDVTNELVQMRIGIDAYKDAQRAIFLQDNAVTDAYKAALASLQRKNKTTGEPSVSGKAMATASRVLLPIIKVPTNIVAETMQYAVGSVTGSLRLGRALSRGLENLSPEEADVIMRSFKKGSIGLGVMALGYLNPQSIGGYYQPGEKRKPNDPKAGTVQIYGVNIPSFLLHNPLLETLQLGATVRRVADARVKKTGQPKGVAEGLYAGALGLGEEVPFVRETLEVSKAMDLKQKGAFWGELGKSLVIPQAVQWTAQKLDQDAHGETVKRHPRTVLEHLETGIPVLRENVPKK